MNTFHKLLPQMLAVLRFADTFEVALALLEVL